MFKYLKQLFCEHKLKVARFNKENCKYRGELGKDIFRYICENKRSGNKYCPIEFKDIKCLHCMPKMQCTKCGKLFK